MLLKIVVTIKHRGKKKMLRKYVSNHILSFWENEFNDHEEQITVCAFNLMSCCCYIGSEFIYF